LPVPATAAAAFITPEVSENQPMGASGTAAPARRTTVLIAEDHALVAEGLRKVLEAEPDLEVVGHASNGEEAIRECIQRRPDILLMDLAMPIVNGIEATRVVRERCPATRVIIVSMHGDQPRISRALRAGADGYLLKTSVAKELVDAIHEVRRGRKYLTGELTATVINDLLDSPVDPLERLSTRERQVLQMLAEGRSTHEIAERLSLSPKTVETYRGRMMAKVGVRDLAGLVKFAIQQGVIALDG
jgi:DNA-binding NarL/FixJ family response regulator